MDYRSQSPNGTNIQSCRYLSIMKKKTSNPAAVALGRLGGSKTTEAQKASRAKNAVKARKRKAELRAAKLYPSVYVPLERDESLSDFVKHSDKMLRSIDDQFSPRRHTRAEVPIGKGVAKARKDGAM